MILRVGKVTEPFLIGPRHFVLYTKDVTKIEDLSEDLLKILRKKLRGHKIEMKSSGNKKKKRYVFSLDGKRLFVIYEPDNIKDKAFLVKEINKDLDFDTVNKILDEL